MESDQVHFVAAAVFRDSQQIFDAFKTRLARQIVRDIFEANRRNRVHDDVAFLHWIPAAHLHAKILPDANAASDFPLSDSVTKAFGEYHMFWRDIRGRLVIGNSKAASPSSDHLTAYQISDSSRVRQSA